MYTWNSAYDSDGAALGFVMAGGIAGMVLSIVISFKQSWAPVLAPVFALAEGLALGGISAVYERAYGNGIAFQAMFATVCVFGTMLLTYQTGIIKVTDRFRAIVSLAMLSIFVVYLASFLLSFANVHIPGIFDSGGIGIGFSLLVIGIASAMLLVDFDMIERGARAGAPKYMEWYAGFALMVTIVWIYLEMLRLLAKLRSR
jgi:uncharacterized YccA/Bax inhibitor family protein